MITALAGPGTPRPIAFACSACAQTTIGAESSRLLIQPERAGDDLPERDEIDFARGRVTPREPDGPARQRRREAQELHPFVAHLDVDRDLRKHRNAMAVGAIMDHGRVAGGT